MITALVFAAALTGMADPAQDANTVEGLTVTGAPKRAAVESMSDKVIEDQLFQLLETQPDRVVCAVPRKTGSRMPKPVCGTVERWFNARTPAEIAAGKPPWRLMDEIRKNQRKIDRRG